MSIKDILLPEFKNWKLHEIIVLIIATLTIFLSAIYRHETPISILYAVCGILYTIIAGKGKVICFLFGITATCCYSYMTFKSHIYGNFLLNFCYYLPMQILAINRWRKNLNIKTKEIIKIRLTGKARFFISSSISKVCMLAIIILAYFKDSVPILDGAILIFSILAMYLTLRRCIEQWIAWTMVNLLSVLMWLKLYLNGTASLSTLMTWVIYLVIGIHFYYTWKRDLSDEYTGQTNLKSAS